MNVINITHKATPMTPENEGAYAARQKTRRVFNLPTPDFSIEITRDEIGATAQLLYQGRASSGMSEFTGRSGGDKVQKAMAEFLRTLASQIEAIKQPS